MKPAKTYLKGKSIFFVSLVVISITIITVYATGVNSHRSITNNSYISLGIIAISLFLFLTYGLYKGIAIKDNFPKLKDFKFDEDISLTNQAHSLSFPEQTIGEGIVGIIISIILWIVMTIVIFILLIILEAAVWFSLAILLTMLYWIFFRALRVVFAKTDITKNNLNRSLWYALCYTSLYVGWLFGLIYVATIF